MGEDAEALEAGLSAARGGDSPRVARARVDGETAAARTGARPRVKHEEEVVQVAVRDAMVSGLG